MTKNTFFILDVFAERKYSGNQLAVFKVDTPITDAEMQQIAGEINFSETTFILSDMPENGGYPVRIFTPTQEVPFAGHPTLGTAYVIQKEIIRASVERIVLNLEIGQIPVSLTYNGLMIERLTMKQNEPVFLKTVDKKAASDALGISESDIDVRFPVQEVSTGLPFIIVPLKNLNAIKKAKINREAHQKLTTDTEAKAIFLFCPETYNKENQLNARMFADCYGIPEDPATGSANGCLAAYLVKHRYFEGDHINVRVEQGYEMGRPSLLYIEGKRSNDAIEVFVGGNVIEVAKGNWQA
ncbi:MAG TPA: phenazine biosynthesis protein [Nitrospiraceae bacterium]|nr:phenazine biosynthesis protein [Nitrospiraceae bacterium]